MLKLILTNYMKKYVYILANVNFTEESLIYLLNFIPTATNFFIHFKFKNCDYYHCTKST